MQDKIRDVGYYWIQTNGVIVDGMSGQPQICFWDGDWFMFCDERAIDEEKYPVTVLSLRLVPPTNAARDFLLAEIQKTRPVVGGTDDYRAKHDLWDAYIAYGFDSHSQFEIAIANLLHEDKITAVAPPIGKGGFWYRPNPRTGGQT